LSSIDFITRANADYLDSLYEQYLRDPNSVGADWALFFAGFEMGRGEGPFAPQGARTVDRLHEAAADLVHAYRELGHLIANLDPLGDTNLASHPLLDIGEFGLREADLERRVTVHPFVDSPLTIRELRARMAALYCGTIAFEYADISDKAQRDFIMAEAERAPTDTAATPETQRRILSKLIAAEEFEQFLQTKYLGQKRFSLEGSEALVPLLDALVERGGELGAEDMVFGMAHRGRLNVLVNVFGKPYEMLFAEFEGALLPKGISGDGDVKYHLGFSRDHETASGRTVHMSLCFNPSHLEAVNPVVEGIVRAKQRRLHDTERRRVVPVLLHGDAAFSGQGVVAETIALSQLEGYRTGGTVHVIIDNQVGFTASPIDLRPTRYPSDMAKFVGAPVLHVNADDPEAAVRAARIAIEFRQRFGGDVILHFMCYRRHGHNETDDPSFTQPLMYKKIATHPTVRRTYAGELAQRGIVSAEEHERESEALREHMRDALDYARDFKPRQQVFAFGGAWQGMSWAAEDWRAVTKVDEALLTRVLDGARRWPEGFHVHPKVKRLYDDRAKAVTSGGPIDWGTGEMLAFGTLLLEGTPIRLSGQDAGRGTFSHRHAALRDVETGTKHVPLDHLDAGQARFQVIDSMLSENAVLGFEYGFSLADPRNLVLWEAQFGDFANGAQVVIDQFIASAESKWQRMSGLVLLLPHGYEGQGPEHSSARLERFLQLCAEHNMQVCNLTTPAQLFHALRRQVHRNFRKPLIVMSPKSLLRHKMAVSRTDELTRGAFQEVIPEADALDAGNVNRVVLCSGKVYYDLLVARRENALENVAILRVEQLYPFPESAVRDALGAYPNAKDVVWAQEEPANMGAWPSVSQWAPGAMPEGRRLRCVSREAAASPAAGSYKIHREEEAELLKHALKR
jgi:2-oxoglutarate dehydrogenase E1 component